MAKVKYNTFFVWREHLNEKAARRERFSAKWHAKRLGKDTFAHEGEGMRNLKHSPYTLDQRNSNKVYKKH